MYSFLLHVYIKVSYPFTWFLVKVIFCRQNKLQIYYLNFQSFFTLYQVKNYRFQTFEWFFDNFQKLITICVHKLWLPPITSFSVRDIYMLPLYLVNQIYQTHPFNQFCSIVLARIYCVSQNIKTLISKYMENSTSIYGQNQRETKFIEFNICWHNLIHRIITRWIARTLYPHS